LTHEKKTKFYKILVAVDGSNHSKRAAEYAIDLARNNKAQLTALTVLNIANIGSASAFIASPMHGLAELKQKRKEAQEWLDEVARLATSQKEDNDYIQFKTYIEESMSVAGAIVEFAENQNMDLIVVGSRGRSGFKKLLLGSIASTVVTYTTCPVLIIK
jgi:nucleotide-binding universal stress UspA family protein